MYFVVYFKEAMDKKWLPLQSLWREALPAAWLDNADGVLHSVGHAAVVSRINQRTERLFIDLAWPGNRSSPSPYCCHVCCASCAGWDHEACALARRRAHCSLPRARASIEGLVLILWVINPISVWDWLTESGSILSLRLSLSMLEICLIHSW